MSLNWEFDNHVLRTMIGGASVLDAPRLYIKTLEEAYSFVKSYGFDLHSEADVKKLWYFHRRAVVLIQDRLLKNGETIPEGLTDQKQLGDIRELLLFASSTDDLIKQKWACALLRVMHVFVHSEHDLFSFFAGEIQKQILEPIQACISHEVDKTTFKHPFSNEEIFLKSFEVKPFKTSSSAVVKMLAKPDFVALKVLDKVGVRFVTENLFDAFRVALMLAERNLVNFAHVMPDQSSNNLFPLEVFIEALKEVMTKKRMIIPEEVNALLAEKVKRMPGSFPLIRKENTFSGNDYRFIKFICRKLVTVPVANSQPFSFFYPFEVQIVDYESHLRNEAGESSHAQYKERQLQAARSRVLRDLA